MVKGKNSSYIHIVSRDRGADCRCSGASWLPHRCYLHDVIVPYALNVVLPSISSCHDSLYILEPVPYDDIAYRIIARNQPTPSLADEGIPVVTRMLQS